MNIGQTARVTKVPAKTIRYYETIGLIPAPGRTESGYRVYDHRAIAQLRFVRRARDLGFSLREVGELLGLWSDEEREAREVRALAQAHLSSVERRIAEFEALRRTLVHLIDSCEGDERPECPILDDLARTGPPHEGVRR